MVASYAFGAPGGILQGASDLTGALLGYPLQLDAARRQRALAEQQAAHQQLMDSFQQQAADRAATVFEQQQADRPGNLAEIEQRRQIERHKAIFGGDITVPEAQPLVHPPIEEYDPVTGVPVTPANPVDYTGMADDTPEQAIQREGQQRRAQEADMRQAQIEREKALAAGGGSVKGGKAGTGKVDTREVWEYHVDPATKKVIAFNKVTGERKEFGSMDAAKAETGASAAAGPATTGYSDPVASGSLGTATATRLNAGDPKYHSLPTPEEFNAAQDYSDAHPFIPPAMRGTPLAETFGRPPWQPPPEYAEQYARILATGDPARIAEAERRLGKPAGR